MERKKMIILPRLNNCGNDLAKKWFVYYSVRDPRTDKMQRFKTYDGLHTCKDEKSRKEVAETLIKELTGKLKQGWTPFTDDTEAIYEDQLQYRTVAELYGTKRAANTTFRLYASRFIDKQRKKKVEDKTIDTYKSKLRIFAEWLSARHGEIDITAVTNKIVLDFFNYLIEKKNLAKGTINDYRQVIGAVFEDTKKEGKKRIIENPVYNIPVGVEKDFAPRPVAEWDIETFREAITQRDPQLWLAIEFETYCFLRPGKELRLLKIKDIDFARGLINVDKFRAKTNRERHATIPKHFLLKLRNEYKLQAYRPDNYVFSLIGKPGNAPLGKNNLKNRFNKFRKELNMPETYKFYSWKHTGNGLALDNDINMFDLRNQNGHSSVQITEIYTRNKLGKVSQAIREHFPNLDTI